MVCAVVAVLLAGWMLVLVTSAATRDVRPIGEDEAVARVTCDSVAETGAADAFLLDEETTSARPEDIDVSGGGSLDAIGRAPVERQCQELRVTRVGWLVLLAVPTSVAAAGALLGGRGRRPIG